mmetsp:Transcript_7796/g.18105  ORF Transcript_7796/g.18105 Transcript_7796/m.18105 type:complete len:304 (+) Transcript_7796:722-1633(+)
MGLESGNGLLDLALKRLRGVDEMEQLAVVQTLKQHAGDLAGESTLARRNERVQALTKKLLLLLRGGVNQHGRELLLGESTGDHGHRRGRLLGSLLSSGHGLVLGLVAVADVGRELDALGPLLLGLAGLDAGLASNLTLGTALAEAAAALVGHGRVHGATGDEATTATGSHVERRHHEGALSLGARARGTRVHHRHGLRREIAHVLARVVRALEVLALEVGAAHLLRLVKSDVDGLGAHHLAVHVRDSTGGVIGRSKAHVAEALALAGVQLDLGRGDGAEGLESRAQLVVIDGVIEVLDVQVGA